LVGRTLFFFRCNLFHGQSKFKTKSI
jgi:hypothetical protein